MNPISKPQLKRLQMLFARFAARSTDVDAGREGRLRWASEQLGREVASFNEIGRQEAIALIDRLQGALGIPATPSHRRARRYSNRAAGTEGRNGGDNVRTMATQDDLDRINDAITRLDWTRAEFDHWLCSHRSPLAHKINGHYVGPKDAQLRTLYECNRVWWALKQMLKDRGLWR